MSEVDDWEVAISKLVMRLVQEIQALNPGVSFEDIDFNPIIEQSLQDIPAPPREGDAGA